MRPAVLCLSMLPRGLKRFREEIEGEDLYAEAFLKMDGISLDLVGVTRPTRSEPQHRYIVANLGQDRGTTNARGHTTTDGGGNFGAIPRQECSRFQDFSEAPDRRVLR